MSGAPYVWIRLATTEEDSFVDLPASPDELVIHVIRRACSTLDWGGVAVNKIRLFLVAKAGQPKPLQPVIEAALKDLKPLAEEALLESAGVASGDWLVAVSTVTVPSGGGGLVNGGGGGSSSAGTLDGITLGLPPAARLHQVGFRPLTLTPQDLGGAPMLVAVLEKCGNPFPYFLSPKSHQTLTWFLHRKLSPEPQLLLVSGTIKAGKSTLVKSIIPGMVLQQHAEAAAGSEPRPVFLLVTLGLRLPVEAAAERIVKSAYILADAFGIVLPESQVSALVAPLESMAVAVSSLAEALLSRHCILWLLFDELGAPFTASTPPASRRFAEGIKNVSVAVLCAAAAAAGAAASYVQGGLTYTPPTHTHPTLCPPDCQIVENCATCARIVGTGSGMFTLLDIFRTTPVNSYVLFDSIVHLPLGQEPPPAVAQAMAEQLLEAHAATWTYSPELRPAITAQLILDSLHREAHNHTTSQRPALFAVLLGLLGVLQGTPEQRLDMALGDLLQKLREESEVDAYVALKLMPHAALLSLRRLADLSSPESLEDVASKFSERKLGTMLRLFFEDTSPAQLLPPYGALLRSWVSPHGTVSVARLEDGTLALPEPVTRSFRCIVELRKELSKAVKELVSQCVLRTLAEYSVGTLDPISGEVRPPSSIVELAAIPAVQRLMEALDGHAADTGGKSHTHAALKSALLLSGPAASQFMQEAGFHLLVWMRHHMYHVWHPSDPLERAGLTSAAKEAAVRAAMEAVLLSAGQSFALDSDGGLRWLGRLPPLGGEGGGVPLGTSSALASTIKGGGGGDS